MGGSTEADPRIFLLPAPLPSLPPPRASKLGRTLWASGPARRSHRPRLPWSAKVLLMVIAGEVRQEAISNL